MSPTHDAVVHTVHTAVDHKAKPSIRLRRIAEVEATGHACLVMDEYSEDWSRLWWLRLDGQHPMNVAQAQAAVSLLELEQDVVQPLQLHPTRGALDAAGPVDPTIYRSHGVLQVYGPTLKELIHEQFGDGIMSAINFRLDVKRVADPAGDRVVVTDGGKFLPYQW